MTHSFPPRRSSDLQAVVRGQQQAHAGRPAEQPIIAVQDLPQCRQQRSEFFRRRVGRQVKRRVEQKPIAPGKILDLRIRSEEHTSELQSLMRISYAVFCLKKKKTKNNKTKDS